MDYSQIKQALKEKGILVVGKDVPFKDAHYYWPYLRINSSRSTDYIDDIDLGLAQGRFRPEFGPWAKNDKPIVEGT